MPNKNNQPSSKTDAQQVRKQNQKAAQGQGQQQYESEFASETDAEQVRKQNQQSQQNKK